MNVCDVKHGLVIHGSIYSLHVKTNHQETKWFFHMEQFLYNHRHSKIPGWQIIFTDNFDIFICFFSIIPICFLLRRSGTCSPLKLVSEMSAASVCTEQILFDLESDDFKVICEDSVTFRCCRWFCSNYKLCMLCGYTKRTCFSCIYVIETHLWESCGIFSLYVLSNHCNLIPQNISLLHKLGYLLF